MKLKQFKKKFELYTRVFWLSLDKTYIAALKATFDLARRATQKSLTVVCCIT